MRPRKELPKGSEEITRIGEYTLIKYQRNGKPFYSIYKFFESTKGMRYYPRGGGSEDLEKVKKQLKRITGVNA
jgi:hypothetical protein